MKGYAGLVTYNLRQRIPGKRDLSLIFAACAFPVHTWSILILFWELPAWILRLSLWDMVGVTAYTLGNALLETILLWLALFSLAVILPRKWFQNRMVVLSAVFIFWTTAWMVAAQLNYDVIRTWSGRVFIPWIVAAVLSFVISYFLVHRFQKFENLVTSFIDRLLILAYVYLMIDVFSLVLIIIRNIGGSAWQN